MPEAMEKPAQAVPQERVHREMARQNERVNIGSGLTRAINPV